MFQGKLVNRFSGTSKKSGNTFYSVDIFVDMPSGSRTLLKSFINANLYDKISSIPLIKIIRKNNKMSIKK